MADMTRRTMLQRLLVAGGALGASLVAACQQQPAAAPTAAPAAKPTTAPAKPAAPAAAPTTAPAAAAKPSEPAKPAQAAPAQSSGRKVSLTYGFWNPGQKAMIEQQIAAFQKKLPDVTVEPQVVPFDEYFTKLQTAAAGGAAWDVFWMNGPNFPVYASRGVMADLSGKLPEAGLNAFPKSLRDLYSFQGKLYAVPKDFDTIGLYYNKKLFDEAKVAYPTADWTWNDLKQAAGKLTVKSGGSTTQWGFNPTPTPQEVYMNFVFQNGGRMLNDDGSKTLIDEPAAAEAIQYLYSFTQEGSAPTGAEMQANNSSWQPGGNLFPAGKIAMVTSGSWRGKAFLEANKDIDAAPLPRGKQRATVIHGLGQAVWSKSANQPEAIELVKFLGTREAQNIQAESGAVIPAMNGLQDTWIKSVPGMNLKVFIDAVENSVPYPTTSRGSSWLGKIDQTLRDGWLGQVPPDQMVKRAAEAANAELAR